MFKRSEKMMIDNDYHVPAKRAKFATATAGRDQHNGKVWEKEVLKSRNACDDIWGDDFAEEDIEEMDLIVSQACLREGNMLDNSKPPESDLSLMKSNFLEKPVTFACNKTSQLKFPLAIESSNLWMIKKDMQGTSQSNQDITEINYSQFRNKLMDKKDHNSTFQKINKIIDPDIKELEKLRKENRKLLDDFITKNGETVFLRQQLQQNQLRAENEKLEKIRLFEEQANCHRLEINKFCKEKEQLKTQLELQSLEIKNLLERCKLLESGNIKLEEPQILYVNHSLNKSKCNSQTNRPINIKNSIKEVCVQTNNTHKKNYYQLKTSNIYFPLARISELMFRASLPEKPLINIKVIEKTGKRNLPILQEEETFRIFENPDLVKPVVTMIDDKRLTTEFVLLEIAAMERKINLEIYSERCIPIINKLVLTAKELMLNVNIVLQTIFQAMRNDDIRDMNDLYFSMVYKNHNICVKSECEANAWHEGEHGIEARRLLGILLQISLESTYLSNYLAGKSQLLTRNDECYNHYLQQMTRYNAWPKKDHKFEMLEIILECVTLIGRVRRAHQFTGLITAIVKVLCNVQQKVGYCEKGLEYVSSIFKELVFSRPLSLCYVSLAQFIMVFSKCSTFMSKLCRSSQSSKAIKMWKGALYFTPDACVLQIFMTQIEYFHPDFLTTVNLTHALISSVWYTLQANNNLLKIENWEPCNCYMKLLRFTINMLRKCSETRLDIIDTHWQNPLQATKNCYILKRINYKDHSNLNYTEQDIEKYSIKTYPENLNRNFWFDIKRIQHKVLRQGIRFLCHLAFCDSDFVMRSPDIGDPFHLFIRNIAFFDDLILHENEKEALDRIKNTFILDKGVQSETETYYQNVPDFNQLCMMHFKKKVTPATKRNQNVGTIDNRIYMAMKALYHSKTDYKD